MRAARSTSSRTTDRAGKSSVLSSIAVQTGVGETYTSTITYSKSYYARAGREFNGFERAKVVSSDNLSPTSRTEYVFSTGNPSRIEQVPAGKTLSGTTCSTLWADSAKLEGLPVAVLSGSNQTGGAADVIHESWNVWLAAVTGGPSSVRTPRLSGTRSLDRDPFTGAQKLVASSLSYDSFGNPTLISNLGDTVPISSPTCAFDATYLADEIHTQITWASNTTEWIYAPSEVKACADAACVTALRKNELYYDGNTSLGQISVGDLTETKTWVSFENEPVTWTRTLLARDLYGNVTSVTDEENAVTTIAYADTDSQTPDSFAFPYSSSIQVSLGKTQPVTLTSSQLWDERFGIPTIDIATTGRRIETDLDGLGRVSQVRSSPQSDPQGTEVVLANYSYSLNGTSGLGNSITSIAHWGTGAGETIESRIYLDGLGRPIQRKSQAEGGNWITSGLRRTRHGTADLTTLPFYTASSAYSPITWQAGTPAQATVRVTFDWAGRPLTTRLVAAGGGDSFVTSTLYTLWNRTITDPRGYASVYRADAHGRLARVEQNGGLSVAQMFYDRVGNLTQVIDPIGATTVMKYDSRGLRRKLEDPDISNCGTPANCPWLFEYDDRGLLVSRIDAKGQEIVFSRDELGRVFLKDYVCTSCSEIDVTFSFDGTVNSRGLLDEANGGLENIRRFTYSNWPGLLKNTEQVIGDSAFTTTTKFDLLGRLTELGYPTGELAEYFYNARGALDRVTFDGDDIVASATYDALSRPTEIDWGNGLTTTRSFNSKELLSSLQVTAPGATHLAFGFRHDLNGNPVEVWEDVGFPGGNTWEREYVYDWANRLDLARHYMPQNTLKGTWDYSFDQSGNITFNSEWSGGGLDGTYAYTAAGPHAVTRIGGASSTYTLSYDQNGSLTSEAPGNWYEYNFDGRTSRMGDSGALVDPETVLSYDPFGEVRVRKEWAPSTGAPKDLRYFGPFLEELVEGAQRSTDKYVVAFGQRVALVTTRSPGKTYYLHGDNLGSISLVTDETGAVTERRNYAPFGAPLDSDGTSPATRYGFTGQELDDEVGALHLGIRQYSFAAGRFTANDPLANQFRPQSLNPYSYALNIPTVLVDPSGYEPTVESAGDEILPGWGAVVSVTKVTQGLPNGENTIFDAEVAGSFIGAAGKSRPLASPLDLAKNSVRLPAVVPAIAVGVSITLIVNTNPIKRADSLPTLDPGPGGYIHTNCIKSPGSYCGSATDQILMAATDNANAVILETLTNIGNGNITSQHTLTEDEALLAAQRWVGENPAELGRPGSGVFRSTDGASITRQVRIDPRSLDGAHAPHVPHFHLEVIGPNGDVWTNNHIPLR